MVPAYGVFLPEKTFDERPWTAAGGDEGCLPAELPSWSLRDAMPAFGG